MEILGYLFDALTPFNLMLALVGVVLGTLIGALPGLSATMAVAVLVPFTFTMEPASGMIALGAIYTGAVYGGAYAAILVNTQELLLLLLQLLMDFQWQNKEKVDMQFL